MTAAQLLAFTFVFPLPTLLLSASGLPKRAGALSWIAPAAVFVAALVWLFSGHESYDLVKDGWIPFLPDNAFRLHVDALSGVMLLVVGGVATCVYIYSLGYMHDDERQHRFFAMLDFFVASMCLLVVAGNLGVLLIGWTGVGVASFLLISFYWNKDGGAPLRAGFLALGANAIGDAALLLAAVLLPQGMGALGTLSHVPEVQAPLVAWLLVIAACAKSAQGPLWWWLPSAMAGPTPVSALIHAATMVAAGVYLLVRTSGLFVVADVVSYNVALIGLITAIGGGIASLWQPNFKRGLAYSTVSQLGWMFAAIGVGSPFAALFHLITHASFKAMLFLSAGVVIAATHHEEEIVKLGGLRKKLPVAHATFWLGTLALIGTPIVTAGAFSKDAILEGALHSRWPFIGYLLLVSTLLTGAYAGRLLFGVFYGKEGESSKHAHGVTHFLTLPLIPLAIGAIGLGWIEAQTHALSGLLGATVPTSVDVETMPNLIGLGAFAAGLVGVALGYAISRLPSKSIPMLWPQRLTESLLGEVRAIPEGFAAVHAGRVGRYALIGLVGTALAAYLAQRPVSVQPGTASKPAITGQRDDKTHAPANASDAEKRKAAMERLRQLLQGRNAAQMQHQLQEQQQKKLPPAGIPPQGAKPSTGGAP